jgi:arylsulfatase A
MKRITKNVWSIRFIATAITVISFACAGAQDLHTSKPLNIVILLADDLGYGDLACYGNREIRTPNLDKLAEEGIRFTDAYASAPMCSPSRAGLLTGRIPNRTGIYDWIAPDSAFYLKREEMTLASMLMDHGYQTSMFGKWHLNGKMGTAEQPQPDDHGFQSYFATQYSANHLAPQGFYRNGEKLYQQHGYSCDIVTREAVRWLKNSWDGKAPFFQFISFHEVHEPIASPPDLLETYHHAGKKMLYYANVTNLDRAIGKYLDVLDEMDLSDNTIVIFTSDNGPATWSKGYFERSYGETGGLRGRKRFLWEGGIRVPCIIRWPGTVEGGQVTGIPVSNLDFLPTLTKAAGLKVPCEKLIDGSDITPLLTNQAFQRKVPLSWHFYAPVDGPNSVLRSGSWVLTARWDGGEYSRGRFRRSFVQDIRTAELTDFILYNIQEDMSQEENLADKYPDKFNQLKKELISIHREIRDGSPVW